MFTTNSINWFGTGPHIPEIIGFSSIASNGGGDNDIRGNANRSSRPRNSVTNSNPSLDNRHIDVQVEYEVSVPIVQSIRHTPYHSLWNLNRCSTTPAAGSISQVARMMDSLILDHQMKYPTFTKVTTAHPIGLNSHPSQQQSQSNTTYTTTITKTRNEQKILEGSEVKQNILGQTILNQGKVPTQEVQPQPRGQIYDNTSFNIANTPTQLASDNRWISSLRRRHPELHPALPSINANNNNNNNPISNTNLQNGHNGNCLNRDILSRRRTRFDKYSSSSAHRPVHRNSWSVDRRKGTIHKSRERISKNKQHTFSTSNTKSEDVNTANNSIGEDNSNSDQDVTSYDENSLTTHSTPKMSPKISPKITVKPFKVKPKLFTAHGSECHMVDTLEKEILQRNPGVPWTDVAGLTDAKTILQEAVVLPIIMPDFFRGIRRPWRGVLMVGPPGTGKTMMAKAVATECGTTFFNVSSSTLTSKYRGESEKMVRLLFQMAKYYAPSTIFIDEIDSLCATRGSDSEHEASRRFKAELLIQMDGLNTITAKENKSIMVLAATNHPWDIDEAFRRRFEKRILISLPNKETRTALLKLCLKDIHIEENLDISEIAEKLNGYTGSDVSNVCRDAALMSMRRRISGRSPSEIKKIKREDVDLPITLNDFEDAILRTKKSVALNDIDKFEKWMNQYGSV